MAKPVAVITSDVATTIPVTSAPHTVHLDGTSSTATGPATIASYQWYLDVPPESAAVLSSATSATPSFVMDVPGLYQARLVVTDSNAVASEGFTVRIDPATSPYKFTAPSSAYHAVRMSQALTETVPPTSGAKDVAADERELFFVVEELYGQVQGLSSAAGAYARYVTMAAGSSAADGSAGLPFNPQSAALGGYDGPVQQAVAELALLGTSDSDVPRVVVMQGGDYDEDVSVTLYGAWVFQAVGLVNFSSANTFAVIAHAAATTRPLFVMAGAGQTGAVILGNLTLTGNYASSWSVTLGRVYQTGAGGATETAAMAATCSLSFYEGSAAAAWVLPSCTLSNADHVEFTTLTLDSIRRASHCRLGNVTVASVGTKEFYNCTWQSSKVFTGPAGSARFDRATLNAFIAANGTFASPTSPLDPHASTADMVDTEFTWPKTGGTITNIGGSHTHGFVTSNFVDIGVTQGCHVRIFAIVSLTIDAGDECKVHLAMGNSTGGTNVMVATQSAMITGAVSVMLVLNADVVVAVVGDPGTLVSHYRCVCQSLAIDEEDVIPSTGTIDLDPAISRVNVLLETGAGFGASSTAELLHFSTTVIGA